MNYKELQQQLQPIGAALGKLLKEACKAVAGGTDNKKKAAQLKREINDLEEEQNNLTSFYWSSENEDNRNV